MWLHIVFQENFEDAVCGLSILRLTSDISERLDKGELSRGPLIVFARKAEGLALDPNRIAARRRAFFWDVQIVRLQTDPCAALALNYHRSDVIQPDNEYVLDGHGSNTTSMEMGFANHGPCQNGNSRRVRSET